MGPEHKRHRYKVTETWPIQKNGPTGHPSGWWGMWERRVCAICGVAGDSRYAPGINERNSADVWAAYRERTSGVTGLPVPRPTGEGLAAELWQGDDYGETHQHALASFACAVWERAHGVGGPLKGGS